MLFSAMTLLLLVSLLSFLSFFSFLHFLILSFPLLFSFIIPHPPSSSPLPFLILLPVPLTIRHPPHSPSYHSSSSLLSLLPFLILLSLLLCHSLLPLTIPHHAFSPSSPLSLFFVFFFLLLEIFKLLKI